MAPRATTASKRAGIRRFRSILEHAKFLLDENGVAVDEVYRVESAGTSESGHEEILFSDLDDKPKTAILVGNMDRADGSLKVIDGWS